MNGRTGKATAGLGAILCALSYAFRHPALLNASATNSDAAIVGIQAMHLLRGEYSVHLLGSGYQTSVDSYLAAAFFRVMGPTPLALMVSSLTMHVALTLALYALFTRLLAPAKAFLAVLPLVFTSSVIHSYALYPPRQTALTLGMLAFVVLESQWRFAPLMSALLVPLSAFADPYALLFVPIYTLHFALFLRDADAHSAEGARHGSVRVRRGNICAQGALGVAVGTLPLTWLWFHPQTVHQQAGLELSRFSNNLKLLLDPCLPWILGTKNYVAKQMMDYEPWPAPGWIKALSILGALALIVALVASASAMQRRRLPRDVTRLGTVGAALMATTLVAFLFSVMVMDHFSMRYLVGFVLGIPLAILPWLASEPSPTSAGLSRSPSPSRGLASALQYVTIGLWCASAAVGGWIGFGPFVDGIHPRMAPSNIDAVRMGEALREEGVEQAMADYWASYRLGFLWREHPIVVPTAADQDRIAAQRARVLSAKRYAFIVDQERSYEPASLVAERLQKEGSIERRIELGKLTAFVIRRK